MTALAIFLAVLSMVTAYATYEDEWQQWREQW